MMKLDFLKEMRVFSRPDVLPLGEGGDFETQINQEELKLERTSQCIVTVIPRFCQMAVVGRFFILVQLNSKL
jgi:hypothetical protein